MYPFYADPAKLAAVVEQGNEIIEELNRNKVRSTRFRLPIAQRISDEDSS